MKLRIISASALLIAASSVYAANEVSPTTHAPVAPASVAPTAPASKTPITTTAKPATVASATAPGPAVPVTKPAAPAPAAPAATTTPTPPPPAPAPVPAANSAAALIMPPPGMTAAQQKQIEDIIHYYLVKNPEVIIEAVQALQQKQMEEAHKAVQKTQENAPKLSDGIFHQASDPIIGNAAGKVVVVDFFDYQCPHCTKMTPILETLTKTNPQLRVVFKEFPIRGAVSEFASKIALAAKAQGKYFEFHKALMVLSDKQTLSEESILAAAKTLGLNVDKLKVDMKSDAISKQIKDNIKLGQDLQLLGTPAFFVAKSSISKDAKPADITFIPGQIDQVQLQGIITDKQK